MGGKKKEFLPLPSGDTVLGAAALAFASCPRIGPIVIIAPPGAEAAAASCLPANLPRMERVFFVSGGETRRASVYNALVFLEKEKPSHVLIHDGARPWIKQDLIERIIDAAIKFGAVIPGLPLIETPKELDQKADERKILENSSLGVDFIARHLKREKLCTAQTPLGFKFPEILNAHEKAREREEREAFHYTDDAEVWGEFTDNSKVAVIPGDAGNRKITFPEDITIGNGD